MTNDEAEKTLEAFLEDLKGFQLKWKDKLSEVVDSKNADLDLRIIAIQLLKQAEAL